MNVGSVAWLGADARALWGGLVLHRPLALLVPVVVLVAVMYSGCVFPVPDDGKEPTSVPPTPSPTLVPAEPLAIAFCLDASGSYPPAVRAEAATAFADLLAALPEPGFGGARVGGWWILQSTTALHAGIDTWDIPPVRLDPDPPQYDPEPEPPDPNDPEFVFSQPAREEAARNYKRDLKEWREKVDEAERAYEEELAAVARALEAAQAKVAEIAVAIAATPPTDGGGSDQGGCLDKGSKFLGRAPGERYLVIASDMQRWGDQNFLSGSLSGVAVRVIYFFCERSVECEATRTDWQPEFDSAGVDDLEYYDPVEDISTILS